MKYISSKHKLTTHIFLVMALFLGSLYIFVPQNTYAAVAGISLSPATGTFVVDSTFDISVFLDTGGQSVNAVELSIKFPADRLQLVSSSTGKSIIGIWPTLPKFNNQTGDITLTGGIPNGIATTHGLITTLTFRARAIGSAVVKINQSKVLSNDGSGTEIPTTINNSIFQIILPPPAGPVVVSETHPDQNSWYKDSTISLSWGDEGGVDGFSYMLSDQAVDIPDDISEGTNKSVIYNNIADGRHYFHIKGLRNGQWGGSSHFALRIDKSAPAQFKIEVIPGARTTRRQPVIQFATTDATSGMDHYEIKILSLQNKDNALSGQSLFIEATSPYIPETQLDLGKYDILVRAYDSANNFTEITQHLEVVPAILQNIGEKGLQIRSITIVPWPVVWILGGALFMVLILIAYLFKRHHDRVHQRLAAGAIPEHLEDQLQELQRYREKYGKAIVLLLVLTFTMFSGYRAKAETQTEVLAPPLIKTINTNLSNDELFYAGGFTGVPNAQVILFLQNLQTGETQQIDVDSDAEGEWFYRHNAFLSPGDYKLWGQTKVAGELSPPSSQIKLLVEKKALQFGSSKISLPGLYLFIIIILLLLLICIGLYIHYLYRKIQHKNKLAAKQVLDIEASIRRGFAVLNRDIQAELEAIRTSKSRSLTVEERLRQEQIMKDLDDIEQYLSREIWELEQTERS